MITLLIPLSKCKSFSFAFNFSNANRSHYHSHFGQQGNCPALLCKSDICHHGLRASVHVRIRPIFGSVQIRPENILYCANPTINFPKNSGRLVLRTNPAVYVQIRHDFSRIKMCESDEVFVSSMRGGAMMRVWREVQNRWDFGGLEVWCSGRGVKRLVCCVFGGNVRCFGKIWD